MALRTCTISFKDIDGVRHSVDVAAESVYEAAALGIALFYQHEWSHRIGATTQFEVAVSKEPAVTHTLTFGQILKWSEGGGGPKDVLKKDRVNALITRGKPEPPDAKPSGYRNH